MLPAITLIGQRITRVNMAKYTRYQSVVSRQSDENADGEHWLNQFEKSLQKGAVQPRNEEASLFDQINSVMNGKSKHSSVAAAVEEMRERSGLTAYLQTSLKTSEDISNEGATKTASDQNKVIDKKVDMTPIVIKKCPQIKTTLDNYIRDSKGNLPIPAIIDKIRAIHHNDASDPKDWEDDKLLMLVSTLNLRAKKDNPATYENYSNLGARDNMDDSEIDPSNTDAFHALQPAKI